LRSPNASFIVLYRHLRPPKNIGSSALATIGTGASSENTPLSKSAVKTARQQHRADANRLNSHATNPSARSSWHRQEPGGGAHWFLRFASTSARLQDLAPQSLAIAAANSDRNIV